MTTVAQLTIQMAADVARIKKDMDRAQSTVKGSMQKIQKSAAVAAKALGAIGLALGARELIGLVTGLGDVGRELTKLSRLSGTSVGQFQEIAFAAKTFGIEQEKLGDILKDTQDKVGDFLATGAGGMADFFENIAPQVGVTAENFRKLNGADALQLYITSLEKANLSQAEMTFYMEAIASDSSALIPLFADNGKALKELSKEADRLGIVLDKSALEKAKKLDIEMRKFEATTEGLSRSVAMALIPAMSSIAQVSQDIIRELPRLVDEFKPFMVGGAVVAGLYTLPTIINSIALAISSRLIPSLVLLAPYVAVFSALTLAAGAAIKVLNAQSEALKDADSTARRVVNLQKEIEKAQALIDAGQGSSVTVERLKTMKAQLVEAESALEAFNQSKQVAQVQDQQNIEQQTTIIQNAKDREKAEKKLEKALKEKQKIEQKALEQSIDVINAEIDQVDAIQEQIKQITEQTQAIGLNEQQLRDLELAKIDDAIATKEQRIAAISFGDANDDLIAAYKKQIKALEELKKAKKTQFDKQEVQKVIDANKEIAEQFENDLISAFETAFNRVGDFAESFKRDIEQQFSSMVLRPTIQAAMSKGGSIGGVLSANQGTIASAITGAGFGGQAIALQYGLENAGSVLAKFSGQTTALTAELGALASDLATYAGAITALLGGDPKKAAGAAIGTYLGSSFGPIGSAIGSFIGGSLFGGGGKVSAQLLDPKFLQDQQDALKSSFLGIVQGIGGRAAPADFFFTGSTGRQGQNPNFILGSRLGGQDLFNTYQSRAGETGNNGTFLAGEIALNAENMALFGTRAIVSALQNSDFVDNIDRLFDSVDVRTASLEDLNALLADVLMLDYVNDNFTQMTNGLRQLSGASAQTVKEFFSMIGGIEGLQQTLGFFAKEFTSEENQLKNLTDNLNRSLADFGGRLFSTREQFVNFFNSIGPDAFARVSQLLPAIDSYYDAIEKRQEESTNIAIREIDRIRNAGLSIANYLRNLETSETTLSPTQKLAAAQQQFNETLSAARSGDINALGNLTDSADTLLNLSREFFGSSSRFKSIFDVVTGQLSAVAAPALQADSSQNVVGELRELRREIRESGDLVLTVVTPDGRIIREETLAALRERSRRGELVIYSDGVKS